MIDRPDAAQLLEAMAETLTGNVMPSLDGGAKHSARVVANLCMILAREWDQREGVATDQLRALLDSPDAEYVDLIVDLDRRFADNDVSSELAAALYPIMMADSERRLAIAKPEYLEP